MKSMRLEQLPAIQASLPSLFNDCLLFELDAEPTGDELGEIAKADGRRSDHRPCLQR